jgi:hypothetical protein
VKKLSRTLAVGALVVALLAPALALSTASPAGAHHRGPSSSQAIDWLADNIALTQLQLGPFTKRLVNKVLKYATPIFCPVVASLAAPALQQLVEDQCLGIGTAPDPWAQLQAFTPFLCANPAAIFPDYGDLFVLACKFLV